MLGHAFSLFKSYMAHPHKHDITAATQLWITTPRLNLKVTFQIKTHVGNVAEDYEAVLHQLSSVFTRYPSLSV